MDGKASSLQESEARSARRLWVQPRLGWGLCRFHEPIQHPCPLAEAGVSTVKRNQRSIAQRLKVGSELRNQIP